MSVTYLVRDDVEDPEIKKTGFIEFTIDRITRRTGYLECRSEGKVAEAIKKHKALRLFVKDQDMDCQTISWTALVNHPKHMIDRIKEGPNVKEAFDLHQWVWMPDQERGKTIRIIHKDDGNTRSK